MTPSGFFFYLNPSFSIPLTSNEMRGLPFLVLIFTTYCNLRTSLQHNTVPGGGGGLPSHKDHRLSSPIVYRPCATPSISVTVTPYSHFESGHSTRNHAHNVGSFTGFRSYPQHVPYPHTVLTTSHGLHLHEMRQSSLENESNQLPSNL